MKLLIVTQKADRNDAILGFMHGWILEFAKQCERVTVVCLEKGETHFAENVEVFSLGKERFMIHDSRSMNLRRIGYAVRFLRYVWSARRSYDAVFVHMNPEYVVLGGLLWKILGKKITLWYAHKSVTWSLRLATLFCDKIFTSTSSGFRLKSKKVRVVGQGIDTSRFKIQDLGIRNGGQNTRERRFKIVSVGRITPSKDYSTLIEAVKIICQKNTTAIEVAIIGPAILDSDKRYLEGLKEKISQNNLSEIIKFLPPVSNSELPEILNSYDLFVNMGLTGSLDKAVGEAMASGLPVLTSNEAFKEVLRPFKGDLMYSKGDAEELVSKIEWIRAKSSEERNKLGTSLREIVVREHSLKSFVQKILQTL